MNKEELKTATGQELINERNYCGVDGYYGDYLDNVNEEMLNRFNRLVELEKKVKSLEGNISLHEGILWNDLHKLEKENAELKSHNQELLESCEGATMMYKDLQKAKELLKWWVNSYGYIDIALCNQTDQFINSELEK